MIIMPMSGLRRGHPAVAPPRAEAPLQIIARLLIRSFAHQSNIKFGSGSAHSDKGMKLSLVPLAVCCFEGQSKDLLVLTL
jgi:hypothetical protein